MYVCIPVPVHCASQALPQTPLRAKTSRELNWCQILPGCEKIESEYMNMHLQPRVNLYVLYMYVCMYVFTCVCVCMYVCT